LKDNEDKFTEGEAAEKKAETETELAVLKSALEGSDLEAIKAATEKVATVSQALGAALYAAAATEGAATPNEDGVEDAEIVDEGK
jgi:molecular chaperone DnaK